MTDFQHNEHKIFEAFNNDWALATAGDISHYNTCTISWGSMGTLWNRPVVTVYINPDRYTWEFMKESDTFTVSFYDESFKQALRYLGTKSGRDEDKVANVGFTPKQIGDGVTFVQAKLTYVCRKLYQGPIEREGLADVINNGVYANWQPHWIFIGEVIEAEDKR